MTNNNKKMMVKKYKRANSNDKDEVGKTTSPLISPAQNI